MEAHHIVPQSAGGEDILDNLSTLCSHCHRYVPDDRLPAKTYPAIFQLYIETDQRPELDFVMFGQRIEDSAPGVRDGSSPGLFEPHSPGDYWLVSAARARYQMVYGIVRDAEIAVPASKRGTHKLMERVENGGDLGRPPFGLQFNDAGRRWVPDRESGEFEDALEVIRRREDGDSWREIEQKTGVNRSTARRVHDRRERYLEEAEAAH